MLSLPRGKEKIVVREGGEARGEAPGVQGGSGLEKTISL
jgi:hypothetical protein